MPANNAFDDGCAKSVRAVQRERLARPTGGHLESKAQPNQRLPSPTDKTENGVGVDLNYSPIKPRQPDDSDVKPHEALVHRRHPQTC